MSILTPIQKTPARNESPGRHRATVSACLIVRNEEQTLPDALASLDFCDELIVVDSGSTDDTREIARQAGAKLSENPWPGFAVQRNLALDKAACDWILELDADERVTPELRRAIEEFLASPACEQYEIAVMPIRQLFLGKPLAGSARYPDYRHRLFRRGAYRHDETRSVHEGLTAHGPVYPLEGDLLHLLAGSAGEAVHDALRYARLEAEQIAAVRSFPAVFAGLVLRPPAKWLARMFVFRGWRDGPRGWLKISLDCTADMLVWTRYLFSRRKPASIRAGHFATEHRVEGAVRLVGLASAKEAQRAVDWLERAQAGGADVSLVASSEPASSSVRLQRVRRLTPLAVIQALDREWQIRPYDALVVFAARPRVVAGMLPRRLRGLHGQVDGIPADPRDIAERLERDSCQTGGSN